MVSGPQINREPVGFAGADGQSFAGATQSRVLPSHNYGCNMFPAILGLLLPASVVSEEQADTITILVVHPKSAESLPTAGSCPG